MDILNSHNRAKLLDMQVDGREVKNADFIREGVVYKVPCFVKDSRFMVTQPLDYDEQSYWMDLDDTIPMSNALSSTKYVPVIDHPHSDKENGQELPHYHIDDRFTGDQPHLTSEFVKDIFVRFYPDQNPDYKLAYVYLQAQYPNPLMITPPSLIGKSKLAHKCIHKGKCPHRGYDLSGVVEVDGKITCPLHGLQFDAITGVMLNNPLDEARKEKERIARHRAARGVKQKQ